MLFVYFKAPFGAFKPFQSIELHTTADFITHSAAYGLLLGLAGVDRHRKKDFIGAQVAIGQISKPFRGRVLQQLHKMPKQNPGQEALERAKGNKSKVDIFRRDYLCGLEGFVGLIHDELEVLVKKGICEPSSLNYWGLPFMGDNNFFIEKLEIFDTPPESSRWFEKYNGQTVSDRERLHFLSVWTDYEDYTLSNAILFALTEDQKEPPKDAWVDIREKEL